MVNHHTVIFGDFFAHYWRNYRIHIGGDKGIILVMIMYEGMNCGMGPRGDSVKGGYHRYIFKCQRFLESI